MAVNKRKVLDAARKFAQKGAKQKALKEYSTLLKLDPRDAKLHLEIGDAHRRWGEIDEAIAQYLRVADQYKADGFDARAVAVFKQVLNLDPKRYAAYVSLSELYQRIGLDSEAVAALQTAADGFHKEGKKREALDLLRRMAALDPSNTTNRLKVAELLRQEGMEDDAISEYDEVAEELSRQGDKQAVCSVYERILEIAPKRVETLVAHAHGLMDLGSAEAAEPFAKRALESEPEDTELFELLLDLYRQLDREDELTQLTRRLAKVYRERGDDSKARELLQRLPSGDNLPESDTPEFGTIEDLGAPDSHEPTGEMPALDDEELIEDSDFIEFDEAPTPKLDDAEPEIELGDEASPELEDDSAVGEADDSNRDPDQMLAEASVYLRYGKIKQAIAGLRGVLRLDPDHRPALEKLGDAYCEHGDESEAVGAWSRAAEVATGTGDTEGFGLLVDRIRALDAGAADTLQEELGAVGAEPELELTEPEGIDISLDSDSDDDDGAFEIDLDAEIEIGFEDEAGEEPPPVAGDLTLESAQAEEGGEFELDLDDSMDEVSDLDASDDDGTVDVEVDGLAFDEDDDAEADTFSTDVNSSSGGLSATTSERLEEDLEEAEFYFGQSLFDEAEAIYQRVLEAAPNHPSAQLRMGEIAAARGQDPNASGTETSVDADIDIDAESGDALLSDSDVDVDAEGESQDPFIADPDVDLGDAAEDGLIEDFDDVAVELSVDDPEEDVEASAGDTDTATTVEVPDSALAEGQDADVVVAAEMEQAEALEAADFDLGAALRDSLDDEPEPIPEPEAELESPAAPVDGFEVIFADFKKGVSQTLSDGDYQTRYDLGLAYREMELYDDAIDEFRMCLESPALRFQSLHMMGISALGLGRHEDAASHLEQALAMPDLSNEAMAGVRFDLARVYEAQGDVERTRATYQAVLELDPDFPGVAKRLESLGQGGDAELAGEEDGDYESLDDIFTADEPEALESFDDVITDVEAVEAEPLVEAAEVVEVEESKPDESSAAKRPKSGGGRKKKISFV